MATKIVEIDCSEFTKFFKTVAARSDVDALCDYLTFEQVRSASSRLTLTATIGAPLWRRVRAHSSITGRDLLCEMRRMYSDA